MKKFIQKLFSGGDDVSCKRVASYIALFVIVTAAVTAIITSPGHLLPSYMFDGLLVFAGTGLGITAIEKIFGRPKSNTPDQSTN